MNDFNPKQWNLQPSTLVVRNRDSKQIILISLNPEEFKLAIDKSNDAWETMCDMVYDRLGIKIIDKHDLLWLNNRPLH